METTPCTFGLINLPSVSHDVYPHCWGGQIRARGVMPCVDGYDDRTPAMRVLGYDAPALRLPTCAAETRGRIPGKRALRAFKCAA